MKRWTYSLCLILFLITACQAPTAQSETVPSTATPEAVTSPLRPEDETAASPLLSDIDELGGAEEIGRALKPLVAEDVGVAPTALKLVEAEAVEWADASLGCPQPGMYYAQMITPGWRFIYEDDAGERYDIRAPQDPTKFRLCEADGKETRPTPSLGPAPQGVLDAAKRVVARQGSVTESALTVRKAEPVEWSNSCLGCARPDEACLMVITPGYRVLLEAGDARYEVHTDASGENARLCKGGGGGALTPSPAVELPEQIWEYQRALVAFLDEQYPGFGLPLLSSRAWDGRNVTEEGKLGAETYLFSNGTWVLQLTCPVVPEPSCTGRLRHDEIGQLWQGEVDAEGRVTELEARPTLTYTVTPFEESLTPGELDDWAGLDVSPITDGFTFTQRLSYVCCASVKVAAGWDPEANAVRLVASNLGEVCRCVQGYEIRGTVEGLAPDTYTVEFWGVYKPAMHALEQRAVTEITVP
jgi:hypothetical protein